jgi:hypothetical protein
MRGYPVYRVPTLKVEQTAAGELAHVELPAEVYGSPTTTLEEEDHTAGLHAECRPSGNWVELP